VVLDHINLPVSDIERSKRFFQQALSPLGYELLMEHGISGAGFGHAGKPDFWIKQGVLSNAVHVAFASPDRVTVDAYYEAAIAAGGRHNGRRPGLRPKYHSTYYGAFVLDPDGNNIEAVCHRPEGEAPRSDLR
jgi:catechol 2,3-dioxygenase-like lactoylglutathione lyase family enzyme